MIRLLTIAALLTFGLSAPASAYMGEPLQVGNWEGGAYFNDETRQFSLCALSTNYQNGVYLVLGWGPGGLTIGFSDERWNRFEIGSQTNVRIQIDNRWDSSGPAQVVALGHLVTTMGSQPQAVTAVRRGLQLTATIGKETLHFDLTATNAAVDALANCYRRNNN